MSDDFREYNDDCIHDMWVDYTAEQYDDGDSYPEYVNVVRPRCVPKSDKKQKLRIDVPATTVEESEDRLHWLRMQLGRKKQSLENLRISLDSCTDPRKKENYNARIAETCTMIADLENQIVQETQNEQNLKARESKRDILLVVAVCLASLLIAAYMLI